MQMTCPCMSEYKQEVEILEDWCRGNNLCISVGKMKEEIMEEKSLPLPYSSEEQQ